jgi:catechol-2,3-dioxygenase
MLTTVQAGAYLHHLHLHTPDPARLASFYADVMDMAVVDLQSGPRVGTFLLAGPGRRLILSDGPARTLGHAGFALRDQDGLDGLCARAEALGLAPAPVVTPLFGSGAFAVTDPDHNTIVFGLAQPEPPRRGLRGPVQHLTLATKSVKAIEGFYAGKLGFAVADRVVDATGRVTACFMRGNHEHHNLACFLQDRAGIDHHSYEAGEWDTIRDWADRFAQHGVTLMWGPGRHGPGNNLFIFIEDPDGNWIEVSAELEVIHDRPVKEWPHEERTLNLWGRAIMRS